MQISESLKRIDYSCSNDPNFNIPVRYLYVEDLNGDGIDELITAGFETQPNTPGEFDHSKISIFGWKNGDFQNITTDWMPNGIDQIEGAADLAFGDFNGDGLVDIYSAAGVDMTHKVNSYQFLNKGNYFTRSIVANAEWEHGSDVYDINLDGIDDVIPAGYGGTGSPLLGSAIGLYPSGANWYAAGSDVVFSDFFNNGTVSGAATDNGQSSADTRFFKLVVESDIIYEDEITFLPEPQLEKIDIGIPEYNNSHDIRIEAFDFSKDGIDDLILFSRGGFNGQEWVVRSSVQFYENDGFGGFEDKTELYLENYDSYSNVGYVPIFRDFDLDGKVDIFQGDSQWSDHVNSYSVLKGTQNNTFIDSYRLEINSLLNSGDMAQILLGPNGKNYLVTDHLVNQGWNNGGAAWLNLYEITFPERDESESLADSDLDDTIYGMGGNDTISLTFGNDFVDAGSGIDMVVYSTQKSSITKIANGYSVNGDTLINVERIQFADANIALDTEGATSGGGIYRLYQATFARTPDKEGYGFWLAAADNGLSAKRMAEDFTMSAEFQSLYGVNTTDPYFTGEDVGAMITGFYNNILGRDPDQSGYDFWVGVVENKIDTVGGVLTGFSESEENYNNTIGTIQLGMEYDLWV